MYSHNEITDLPFLAPPPRYTEDRRRRPTRRPLNANGKPAPELERRARRERRATPRLQCEVECEERLNNWRYFRITHDLSTFGLSTRHGSPYPTGTRLQLRLFLPDSGPPLELSAEVVGARNKTGGIRMAFRSPPREAVQRLHRFIHSRTSSS